MRGILTVVSVSLTLLALAGADAGAQGNSCELALNSAMAAAHGPADVDAANAAYKACTEREAIVIQTGRCRASRAGRLASAQEEVKAWRAWLLKVSPYYKRVRTSCGYVEQRSPDGATQAVFQNGKVIVSPVMVEVLVCKGGKPTGVSDAEIDEILRVEGRLQSPILRDDAKCDRFDAADGAPALSILHGDAEGIKRVMGETTDAGAP